MLKSKPQKLVTLGMVLDSPERQTSMRFEGVQQDMTQTLMKALSDLKEPNITRPRSRIQSNMSSSSNKERRARASDMDERGSQRSERKSNNIG